jgi:hypothetical protein
MSLEHDLRQFTGSENVYKNFTGLRYTDGVKYLAEKAGAYWLIDAIGSYQRDKRLQIERLQEFQLWTLTVKENVGLLQCFEDSGVPATLEQEIEFTDFPLPEIKLYVEGGVLLLPSEH